MVRINEIRVGNWLSIEDGSRGTVKSVGQRIMLSLFSRTRGYLPEELSGIKVNRDIISLCNFQPHNAGYIHKETFLNLRYYDDGDITIGLSDREEELCFVHQLQNFYFDATGESLDPNLCGV